MEILIALGILTVLAITWVVFLTHREHQMMRMPDEDFNRVWPPSADVQFNRAYERGYHAGYMARVREDERDQSNA